MRLLKYSDASFASDFDALVNDGRGNDDDVRADVSSIINQLRTKGDTALIELTQKFDGFDLATEGWVIGIEQCQEALETLDPELRAALELAAQRIAAYHEAQKPEDRDYRDEDNIRLGAKWSAVDAAGIYVPGGRAAYPSSVLMNAIPAKVAGVERLVMVTPTPNGEVNKTVLAAAAIAGVDEIYRIGGAQAIAALAYGTDIIAPVDVITGPGNAWVAEAKRQVYGTVGIDMVAGPSEIVVVADNENDPSWIAADLLSQAEHDPTSQSILFTDDADFADKVSDEVDALIAKLATGETAEASWRDHGAIIICETLDDAMPLVNKLAAEHVELAVDNPDDLFAKIKHAGSVFLGRHTPEAIGDYIAGPNHVLPTGRRARFASGLSVLDYMKRTSFIAMDENNFAAIGPSAVRLAEAEGLPAHAESVRKRLS